MHFEEYKRLVRRVEELEREVERLRFGLKMAMVTLKGGYSDAMQVMCGTLNHKNGC